MFIIIFLTPGGSKITEVNYKICLVQCSELYSGRSSSLKQSWSKTELKRCTTTEIRCNKNDARTSPVVSTNRRPNSLKNWRASLLIGPWDSTAIGINSSYDDSPAYLTTLLDAANSAASPASRE